jgi:hypothetical protein
MDELKCKAPSSGFTSSILKKETQRVFETLYFRGNHDATDRPRIRYCIQLISQPGTLWYTDYKSPGIVRIVASRRIIWAARVAKWTNTHRLYGSLVVNINLLNPEGDGILRKRLGSIRREWNWLRVVSNGSINCDNIWDYATTVLITALQWREGQVITNANPAYCTSWKHRTTIAVAVGKLEQNVFLH